MEKFNKSVSVGNNGPKVRSDCYVTLELKNKGGIQIDLQSKVTALYGSSIIQLCNDELKYFGIEHAKLSIDDRGSLPLVLMARIECAVKKLIE